MKSWPKKPLREVADVIMGQSPPGESYNARGQGVALLNGPTEYGERNPTAKQWTTQPTRLCEPGDILFCVRGSATGRMNWADRQYCLGRGLAAIRAKPAAFVPEFLALNLSHHVEQVVHRADEGVFPNLDKSELNAFEISVPPLAEQRRIVARVEALTCRANELLKITADIVEAAQKAVSAFYGRIAEGAPAHTFGDVAKLARRPVNTTPEGRYAEMGVRSFGRGTFHKPVLTGKQLGNKRVFQLRTGDLVFMNVFAWEGAIAIAQPDDDGRVGSHRFLAHQVNPALATAEFLCHHFLTAAGLEAIGGASPGSAGRNRTLGIEKLRQIPVPVPPIEDQRRFAELRKRQRALQRLQREVAAELASFTPALLAKAFRGEL